MIYRATESFFFKENETRRIFVQFNDYHRCGPILGVEPIFYKFENYSSFIVPHKGLFRTANLAYEARATDSERILYVYSWDCINEGGQCDVSFAVVTYQ